MAQRPHTKESPPEVDRGKVVEERKMASGKSSGVLPSTFLQALIITAAVLWIYWPVLQGDWLWDDDQLVTDNAIVHDPAGLWKIWFEPGLLVDYQPLKFSVIWLQWHLWGNHTLGYHLTNIVLHIIGSLLVWRLLSKFGLQLAWLGGLIFAIHPVQVESVAWIAELKNTLSLPPLLLAMCAWIDFEEHGKRRDYFLALGLFLAAMLCKPTMVMFPVVILLYAWWKRDRIGWRDIRACAPFFLVSLILGLVTLRYFIGEDPIPMGGFFSRLACAGLSLSFYLSKCFLPVGLMPIYPRWVVDPPTLMQFLPWPILAVVIFRLWTKRAGWGRCVLLGFGFFLINLAPFIGFNTASYMLFTWVMDHMLYLPIIGLIGLAVAALGEIENQIPPSFRPGGIGLIAVALALLTFQSHTYAKIFLNSETLWTYELQRNPEAWPAHNNLGFFFLHSERPLQAIGQFEQTLRIKPDYAQARNNLGQSLLQTGRTTEAIEQFKEVLKIRPDAAEAYRNLGLALLQEGRVDEATEQYRQAIQIKPGDADAHFDLGNALRQAGRFPEAIEQFKLGLQIEPDAAPAHNELGFALLQTGQPSEAVQECQAALQIKPDYAEAHSNLGYALWQMDRKAEALAQLEQAVQIKPQDAGMHYNLGYGYQQAGRLSEAMEQYQEALRLKPDFATARENLAQLQALQKTAPAKN